MILRGDASNLGSSPSIYIFALGIIRLSNIYVFSHILTSFTFSFIFSAFFIQFHFCVFHLLLQHLCSNFILLSMVLLIHKIGFYLPLVLHSPWPSMVSSTHSESHVPGKLLLMWQRPVCAQGGRVWPPRQLPKLQGRKWLWVPRGRIPVPLVRALPQRSTEVWLWSRLSRRQRRDGLRWVMSLNQCSSNLYLCHCPN